MLFICYLVKQVDTPVKRMSMSGRRLSEGNGRRFAVSGTIDDRDMSADLQLISDVPGFDVSLQLGSGNMLSPNKTHNKSELSTYTL